VAAGATRAPWRPVEWAGLGAALFVGIAIRLILLPAEGLRGDLDQFVGWVHHIATNGLGSLYGETAAGPVTFGPVMGYIWAGLGSLDSGFRTATDASDVGLRMLMKLPASIADIGLALLVGYALRERPRWAVVGAAVILLHPGVIDVSAWWGQSESIYALAALAAAVLAINGRSGWAVAALTVAVMTKPQALPLVVPLAAWIWGQGGWRGLARAAVIGAGVAVVLWLPFVPEGGPAGYLANLGKYQGETFAFASLRAWNLWWIVQEAAPGTGFVPDGTALIGSLTLRHVGFALAGILEALVAFAVIRDPRPRTLALAFATSALVAFSVLTTMHERYAFAALVFLALLIPERAGRWLGLAFGVVFTLNLLAAIPPTTRIGEVLPVTGALGIAGSIAMLAISLMSLALLLRVAPDRATPSGSPAR
jgi:dolichyl-phosphate-mannose-protein mannosyltransferase